MTNESQQFSPVNPEANKPNADTVHKFGRIRGALRKLMGRGGVAVEHAPERPVAAKPNVTNDLQPANVYFGDGEMLKDAPVDAAPASIVPAETPANKPEWGVDKRPGGVPFDAQPMPPEYSVSERPGGMPAGEPIPPHSVTQRPGGFPHQ